MAKNYTEEEFIDVCRTLEEKPVLVEILDAAQQLTPEDLKKLIDYASRINAERGVDKCQ